MMFSGVMHNPWQSCAAKPRQASSLSNAQQCFQVASALLRGVVNPITDMAHAYWLLPEASVSSACCLVRVCAAQDPLHVAVWPASELLSVPTC